LILVHHRLHHQVGPVAVNFRRREVNESKLQALLQTNDVLGANSVRAPESFVKVFAVPTSKLSGAVIDIIEWTTTFEHTLDLSKLADVATRVKRHFNIRAQTEADLIGLMWQVARDDVMTAAAQFSDQARADRAEAASDENVRHACVPRRL